MIGGLGFSVEEPEKTSNIRDFLLTMCGFDQEKRYLRYTIMIIEQLKALKPGFCNLTNYQKTRWGTIG